MKLMNTYKQILNELFEVDSSLEIQSIQKKGNVVFYLINNFETVTDVDSKRISILYGMYTRDHNNKVVSPGFDWGTLENLRHYGLAPSNQDLNEIAIFFSGYENLDMSASAWVKAVGLCPLLMRHFNEHFEKPNVYVIFGKEAQKNRLYKSPSFIGALDAYVGDQYDIHNDLFNCVYLTNKESYSEEGVRIAIEYANSEGIPPK